MKEYALKQKAILSSPFHEKEVTLRIGSGPDNVIPFPRVIGSRPCSPRQSSATIDRLYSRFVAPWFPEKITRRHQTIFLKHTIPFLLEATCPQVTFILCSVFHRRNQAVFGDSYGWFNQECHKAVAGHLPRKLPPIAAHPKIKTLRQKQAIRIICSLAAHDGAGEGSKGRFYLAERDLQARLLLPTPATAGRILKRLCELGVIVKVGTGQTHWEAARAQQRAMANSYRLEFSMGSIPLNG